MSQQRRGSGNFQMDGYVDVASRIALLRERHPEASLQPLNHDEPFRLVQAGERLFVVYAAACYRSPDDSRPGIGIAWEPFPGPTPYTRDSELQNAETSAWGRAIVAALAADTTRGVASADEVRARRGPEEVNKAQLEATRSAVQHFLEEFRGDGADAWARWKAEAKPKYPYSRSTCERIDSWLEGYRAAHGQPPAGQAASGWAEGSEEEPAEAELIEEEGEQPELL